MRPMIGWRAMTRALDELEDDLNEAELADAGFDGGEFSGPAHWRTQEEAREELAAKYGWDLRDLHEVQMRAEATAWDRTVGRR